MCTMVNFIIKHTFITKRLPLFKFLLNHTDEFMSYINLEPNPFFKEVKCNSDYPHAVAEIFALDFGAAHIAEMNKVKMYGLSDIFGKIGGLYTAIFKTLTVLISPLLYRSFVKSIARNIDSKEEQSLKSIRRHLASSVSFPGIYHMHTKL